jgi:hypothetical protein
MYTSDNQCNAPRTIAMSVRLARSREHVRVRFATGPILVQRILIDNLTIQEILAAVWLHERGLGHLQYQTNPFTAVSEALGCATTLFVSEASWRFAVVTYHRAPQTVVRLAE